MIPLTYKIAAQTSCVTAPLQAEPKEKLHVSDVHKAFYLLSGWSDGPMIWRKEESVNLSLRQETIDMEAN
jgi:hypothetical protein